MKRLFSLAIVAAITALPLAHAQSDDDSVAYYEFPEERIDVNACWFLQDTVRGVTGDLQSYRDLAPALRDAETPIRQYVSDSLSNSEDAVGMAFRDFSAWYAYRINEQNEEELTERKIAEIVGQVLERSLDIMLPGSGTVVTTIRSVGTGLYDTMVDNFAPTGTTSPQAYLDQVAGELEDNDARLRIYNNALFNDISNQPLMDQVETIKFEYVMERRSAERTGSTAASRLAPDSCTGQMLEDLGIRRPTPANAEAVRREVLADLMYRVLCASNEGNPVASCRTYGSNYRQVAAGAARRLVLVGRGNVSRMYDLTDPAQLAQICPRESTATLWDSPDCRRWRASR